MNAEKSQREPTLSTIFFRLEICHRLRKRARNAGDNPMLLNLLAKEAQAMACDIPELLNRME